MLTSSISLRIAIIASPKNDLTRLNLLTLLVPIIKVPATGKDTVGHDKSRNQ
jgi:hypothetical protein